MFRWRCQEDGAVLALVSVREYLFTYARLFTLYHMLLPASRCIEACPTHASGVSSLNPGQVRVACCPKRKYNTTEVTDQDRQATSIEKESV